MLISGKNVLKETQVKDIHKVYLKESFKDKNIISYLQNNNIRYEIVSFNRLNNMVKNNQGIVIDINDYEYYKLDDILEEDFVIYHLIYHLIYNTHNHL